MQRRGLAPTASAFVLVIAPLLAGCAGDDGGGPSPMTSDVTSATTSPPPEPTAVETTATTSAPTATASTGASTTVGPDGDAWPAAEVVEVVEVVTEWLNGTPVDQEAYAAVVSPTFAAEVPHAEFTAVLDSLVAMGPWALAAIDEGPTMASAIGRLADGAGGQHRLHVELNVDGLAEMIWVEPVIDVPTTPTEAIDQLQSFGTVHLLAADVGSDESGPTCGAGAPVGSSSVESTGADEIVPIASAFKLYVLGAVVQSIDAGELAWDATVTVRDELRSIPSGVTQDEPEGAELTVRQLASRMISISDNTATDLLIDAVGREAAERALVEYGHAHPDATLPLLTTRELTIIKFSGDGAPGLLERYIAADVERRRAILVDEVAALPLPDLATIGSDGPVALTEVAWLASPRDLCRVLVGLLGDPQAREILAENPGVPDEDGRFAYIGFKGGSEPGLLAVAWIVEGPDGARAVLTGAVFDRARHVPIDPAITAFAVLRDALAP